MSTTTIEPAALVAEDRCDRCGAQALVRVVLPSGELLFCRHHYAKHATTLRAMAVRVDDFTDRLDPSAS
jgi:4-hydroxyphenylpyruvate dioxygenase-like putative hemolysin